MPERPKRATFDRLLVQCLTPPCGVPGNNQVILCTWRNPALAIIRPDLRRDVRAVRQWESTQPDCSGGRCALL